jgi:four helix bundle protein
MMAESALFGDRQDCEPPVSVKSPMAPRLQFLCAIMNGVWRFEDLGAWKLAVQLETFADRLCAKDVIKRDFKFRDQLADAAASGPRNIAEGFGRFHHPDFAKFARIAKASEHEVLNHLRHARAKAYITQGELDDGLHAARKALKAVNGLIRYLDATPDYGKQK